MTLMRTCWVECDVCGDVMSNADIGAKTAAEARSEAKADGGHVGRRPPGRPDICAPCWEAGER